MAPTAIAAALVAAALAPFVPTEASVAGGFVSALLAQLGQVGGNYVTDAVEMAMRRLRSGRTTPVTEAEVRDAIADELERRLAGAGAEGLREDMSAVLRSVDGVETALSAALDTGVRDLQERLARALAELGTMYAEFGDLSEVVVTALETLQRG